MAEYLSVEEARNMSGLRLVLSPGVPGPWSEAAKGICYVKKLPYLRVRQEIGGENRALQDWTAQTTAPVAAWNDERPRSTWIEQLYLAERLAPNPPLIPASIEDRALMFGYSNELCGEHGFGWSKRLLLIHPTFTNPSANEQSRAFATYFGKKYGYNLAEAEAAPARIAQILRLLGTRLEQQRAKQLLWGDRRPPVRGVEQLEAGRQLDEDRIHQPPQCPQRMVDRNAIFDVPIAKQNRLLLVRSAHRAARWRGSANLYRTEQPAVTIS